MHNIRLAVDIGGTFTDVVLEHPGGIASGKVLTTPEAPEKGVAEGVVQVLGLADIAPGQIGLVVHGTTLATNAIIERRGARTALVTTAGFRDTLEIAHGHRFDQYDLTLTRPEPLIERPLRLEIGERLASDGSVLMPLDEASVRAAAAVLREQRIESVAICFLHAFTNGEHERRTRDLLMAELPGLYVSMSHEICPEIREYERTTTTVANAYVQPLMAGYLNRLSAALGQVGVSAPLLLITSAGSLTSIDTAIQLPIRLVESGPAGGAIFAQRVAREIGAREAIAFDMGGTTAKIVLINDFEPRHSRAMEVARAHRLQPGTGIPLRIPVIEMIEIGAGGGSIAHVNELGQIAVGPESAGASPGPACYGLGSLLPTVTDADLLLGKLDPKAFAGGRIRLDAAHAGAAVEAVLGPSLGLDAQLGAAGIAEIVAENMANAIRVHAADNGDMVESRVLIASGGAAPLHAARLAEKLSIAQVVIPAGAGVGSAHGFLQAPVAYQAVRSHLVRLAQFSPEAVNAMFAELREEAMHVLALAARGAAFVERRFADMRYRGQGHELSVELPARTYTAADGPVIEALFHETYRKSYDRTIPGLKSEALTWSLLLSVEPESEPVAGETRSAAARTPKSSPAPVALGRRGVFDTGLGRIVDASVFDREGLLAGMSFPGPALVTEQQTTTYVPPGFTARLTPGGHLLLEREDTR